MWLSNLAPIDRGHFDIGRSPYAPPKLLSNCQKTVVPAQPRDLSSGQAPPQLVRLASRLVDRATLTAAFVAKTKTARWQVAPPLVLTVRAGTK
ncbi:hypothetical protein GWI33_011951 [Rhynchophorus ferrugineus]|uniref:Uncharacterized protein n=1 Tax=Rhynchophorus ferrugineus TaxID=354439 RepID=A0A834IWF3_RHYFE|nr:hypothetical protein GWI33_011951 [Rhynchophorus ferrugineus]